MLEILAKKIKLKKKMCGFVQPPAAPLPPGLLLRVERDGTGSQVSSSEACEF